VQHELTTIDGIQCKVIPDGAVNREAFERTALKMKIVHLLKEATLDAGLGELLADSIREDGTIKWRIWKVTARRSHCLLYGFPTWESLDAKHFGEAFKQSAVVNLNDTLPVNNNSRFSTKHKEWIRFVSERWEQGRRKLILDLNPDVIICGGTFETFMDLLGQTGSDLKLYDEFAIWNPGSHQNPVTVIKAKHPSFRGKHSIEYEEFRLRCQKALGK